MNALSPSRIELPVSARARALLLLGDVAAFVLFVVLGRLSHGFSGDWLLNVVRIAAPFLVGWVVAAWALGAYRPGLEARPGAFLARSALALAIGDGLAFALRGLVLGDNVTMPFALTSLAFTALFVLGWRGLYAWFVRR